jgi:hypothetical protein
LAACTTHKPTQPAWLEESSARRYTWLEASCSDGQLELAQLGFERTLEIREVAGGLELVLESTLATRGCRSTEIVSARPSPEGGYLLSSQASVTLPHGAVCGAVETESAPGTLSMSNGKLVMTRQRSAWCRELDARFAYVPVEPLPLEPEQLATRYAAQFHRGDVAGIARLFARDGALVEPFTRTDDGRDARHEGRTAIAAFFASAFRSVAWHALSVTSIEPGAGPGALTLHFLYMDAALAEPVHGRTSMLAVGGELLQVEIQLEEEPRPRAALARTESLRAAVETPMRSP